MKSNLRNEIKSYIVRSGYTMQEVVDRLSEDYSWSDSVSTCQQAPASLCGMWRRYSLPMPLAMISYGRNGGTHDAAVLTRRISRHHRKIRRFGDGWQKWICKICSACERQN